MSTITRIALATPKGTPKDHKDATTAQVKAHLTAILAASPKDTLSGADIAKAGIAAGILPNVGTSTKDPVNAQGLKVRTYIRRWNAATDNAVGHVKGTMYTGTVTEALAVLAGYTGKVNPVVKAAPVEEADA